MTTDTFFLLLASLLAVPICWSIPRDFRDDGVALFTFAVLAWLSLISALWLAVSSCVTVWALAATRRSRNPNVIYGVAIAVILFPWLFAREFEAWQMIGAAYFTLRNLHVLLDGWMDRDGSEVSLREMMHYQFYLPVLTAGPIHRLPTFRRSLRLRRFDRSEVAVGAERALLGLAMAAILGTGVMGSVQMRSMDLISNHHPFLRDWLASVLHWVQLYFVFAGLSGYAVGVSQMMCLNIEENFNRPFLSSSLLDFWSRWHITLSSWCRDYVFQPATAATRRPIVGLTAAMLAIGLWHETSVYYLLWSSWQVLGIVLNRLLMGLSAELGLTLHASASKIATPIAILTWLSLARPVINLVLGAGQ